jgi:hypothetical protein
LLSLLELLVRLRTGSRAVQHDNLKAGTMPGQIFPCGEDVVPSGPGACHKDENHEESRHDHRRSGGLMNKVDDILNRIEGLEKELVEELRRTERELLYTIHDRKVRFSEEVKNRHRLLAARWSSYVYESGVLMVLTIPVIWCALIPAVLMDAVVGAYQFACFPIYGIPRVKRGDYVVLDRHTLGYLNWIEKLNCAYCGYFNGVMGYVSEVAARTEQYWCPVRHARPVKAVHGRYRHFFEYGDAEGYRKGLAEVRKRFDDLL